MVVIFIRVSIYYVRRYIMITKIEVQNIHPIVKSLMVSGIFSVMFLNFYID